MQHPVVLNFEGTALYSQSQVLDLFPELPAPPTPARKPKRSATKAASMPVTAPVASAAASAAVVPAPLPDGLEALAQQLEQHPDYQILRRLRPRLDWPAQSGGAVTRIVVLDTETTGLDQSRECIIELAMLCVDIDLTTGLPVGPVQVYDGLEDPKKPIPKEIVTITGITDADVRGQALDEARIDTLLNGADLVVAHNAGFDRPFVERRIPRFANLRWACSFADIDWKAQGRSSAKLENLAQALGLFYDAHRAEMDCHALLAVLAAPLPKSGYTGLQALVQAAAQPSFTLQATQAPFEAKDKLKARGYRWNAEQRVWQTRLSDPQLLDGECEWLKGQVYGSRHASVLIEEMDALVKYSTRPGQAGPRVL
jgi:DNA polymerase-3 subunit epsilon